MSVSPRLHLKHNQLSLGPSFVVFDAYTPWNVPVWLDLVEDSQAFPAGLNTGTNWSIDLQLQPKF